MPHQCLSCGFTFTEGSSALLAGCPECKGTRFFYSKSQATIEERQALKSKTHSDMGQVVSELLAEAAPEAAKKLQARADEDGWAKITPGEIRKLVREVQREQKAKKPAHEPMDLPADHKARREQVDAARGRILKELEAQSEEKRPDTVNVTGDGAYAIDVQGLLEHSPIVVHRDGAYVIHLPSLFRQKK